MLVHLLLCGLLGLSSAYQPCPSGWSRGPGLLDSFCYKAVCRPYRNWQDSEAACAAAAPMGHLADIASPAENNFIAGLFSSNPFYGCSGALYYAVGLRQFCPARPRAWTAQTPTVFVNWAPSEPAKNKACTVVYTANNPYGKPAKSWGGLECGGEFIASACKAPVLGFYPPSPPPPVPGSCSSIGQAWCDYDGSGACYQVFDTPSNYHSASDKCSSSDSSYLASVHSASEAAFVAAMGSLVAPSRPLFWLGGNKYMSGGGYRDFQRWSDHSAVDFTAWAAGQPNSGGTFREQSCVAAYNGWSRSLIGTWNDRRCDSLLPFVCKRTPQPFPPPPPPASDPACPSGWSQSPFSGKCFRQVTASQGMNFTSAQAFCQGFSKNGQLSQLAGLHSPADQRFVETLLTRDSWFGLYTPMAGNGKPAWVDEMPVSFTHWGPVSAALSQLPYPGCGYIHGSSGVGLWDVVDWSHCSQPILPSAVCAMQPSALATTPPAPPPAAACPAGWLAWQGNCYQFKESRYNFFTAELFCGLGLAPKYGAATLASINSRQELDFLATAARRGNHNLFWIGLSDLRTPGTFAFNDGSQTNLQPWGPSMPNLDRRCTLMVFSRTAYWLTERCSQSYTYLCKIRAQPPRPKTSVGFCPRGWVEASRMCLRATTSPSGANGQAIGCALSHSGARLANVHSASDVGDVASLLSTQTATGPLWIGLCFSKGKWTWSDSYGKPMSRLPFANWAAGQPRLANVTSGCVATDQRGLWYLLPGMDRLGGVCELAKANKPCDVGPCLNGATCFNQGPASLHCACPVGFSGALCERAAPCTSSPCLNGGRCVPDAQGFGFSCECGDSFLGRACEIPSLCAINPCLNGGTCHLPRSLGGRDFSCSCPSGFKGVLCEFPSGDPCTPYPCANGGVCSPTAHGGFTCKCQHGFAGKQCMQTVSPCASSPCSNGGTCRVSGGTASFCLCPQGFTGPTCSLKDPCAAKPCAHGGTCASAGQGQLSYSGMDNVAWLEGDGTNFLCFCPARYYGLYCQNVRPSISQ